jgi:hypothetical protein
MREISVDHASLIALSKDMQSLAARTDAARRQAIGRTDWDGGSVHDVALSAEVDWFYRRGVQLVEGLRDLMAGQAQGVSASNAAYLWTDTGIGRDFDQVQPGRMRRSE